MAAMTTDPSTAQDTTLFNSSCLFASQWCFAIPHSRKHLSLVFPSTCFFLFEFVSCVFQRNVEEYFYRCEKKNWKFCLVNFFFGKGKTGELSENQVSEQNLPSVFLHKLSCTMVFHLPVRELCLSFIDGENKNLHIFTVHCNL